MARNYTHSAHLNTDTVETTLTTDSRWKGEWKQLLEDLVAGNTADMTNTDLYDLATWGHEGTGAEDVPVNFRPTKAQTSEVEDRLEAAGYDLDEIRGWDEETIYA